MLLCGPSGCGKSSMVFKMLKNLEEAMSVVPDNIVFFYSCWQSLYNEMQKEIKNISFIDRLPDSFEECDLFDEGNNHLIIIDDLMAESSGSLQILKLFTMFRHHKRLSVMLLNQNIFFQGKYSRTISLNTNYFILFNNPRDRQQIKTLAQQMYPDNPKFIYEAFQDATATPFNYLTLDLTQKCPDECRVRSGAVYDDNPIIVYRRRH